MKKRLLAALVGLALVITACGQTVVEENLGAFEGTGATPPASQVGVSGEADSQEETTTSSPSSTANSTIAESSGSGGTPVATTTSEPDAEPGSPVVPGDVPPKIFDSLITYAMEQLNVSGEDISVESSSAWSWPDTAFGCPEKDQMYAQVITEGYWVVLNAHGQQLDFRVSNDGTFLICDPDRPLPENDERSP